MLNIVKVYRAMYLHVYRNNDQLPNHYEYLTPELLTPIPFLPLHQATEARNIQAVKYLLLKGENPEENDRNTTLTPLHIISSPYNKKGMEELLKMEKNRNLTDDEKQFFNEPILMMNEFKHMLKGETEINFNNNYIKLEKQIIKLLLKKGVDVNALDENGKTPLHYGAVNVHNPDVVKLLVSHGANVHALDNGDNTPLHEAVKCCNKKAVKVLLSKGAKTNIHNLCGVTPLHIASRKQYKNNSVGIIKMLIKYNADVNYKSNILGFTALHLAVTDVSAMKTLLLNGADAYATNIYTDTPLSSALKSRKYIDGQAYYLLISFIVLDEYINPLVKHTLGYVVNSKSIHSSSKLSAIFKECLTEVQRISFTRVTSFSLLEFLKKDNTRITEKLYNHSSVKSSLSIFPIYKTLLIKSIKRAKRRRTLIKKAIAVLDECLKAGSWNLLPLELKYFIVRCLNDNELLFF